MDIALGMLFDQLEGCQITQYSAAQMDCVYHGIELLPSAPKILKPQIIYLTDGSRADAVQRIMGERHAEQAPCILYVCPPGGECPVGCCTVLETELELCEVLNQAIAIVFHYAKWLSSMDYCILKDGKIGELINTATEMVQNPIQLYDPSLKLIASSRLSSDDALFAEIQRYGGLSHKTAQYLQKLDFFPQAGPEADPMLLFEQSPISPYAQLFYRIYSGGKLSAILYIVFSEKPYAPWYRQLVKVLGKTLSQALLQMDLFNDTIATGYAYLMQDLLSEKESPQEEIEARAERLSLPYESSYFLVSIGGSQTAAQNIPVDFFIRGCESLHPNARACKYEDEVLVLIHFSDVGEAADHRFSGFLEQLRGRLLEYDLCAGFSRRFFTLSEMKLAHIQAYQARVLGLRLRDSQFAKEFHLHLTGSGAILFDYNDFCRAHMVASFCETVPYHSFCNMKLLELVKSSRAANTNQVAILYAYLVCNCKLTDTAEYLHMHRNSIVYHVRRIEEVMQMSLKDAEFQAELMTTFLTLCLME